MYLASRLAFHSEIIRDVWRTLTKDENVIGDAPSKNKEIYASKVGEL